MIDTIKNALEAIAYGLMVDVLFLPLYVILGAALLGWFGIVFNKRHHGQKTGGDGKTGKTDN